MFPKERGWKQENFTTNPKMWELRLFSTRKWMKTVRCSQFTVTFTTFTTFTTFDLRGLDHKEDDQHDGPNDNQQRSSLKLYDPEIAEKDEIALILSQGAAVNFKPLKFLQQAKDPATANLSENHEPIVFVTMNTWPVFSMFPSQLCQATQSRSPPNDAHVWSQKKSMPQCSPRPWRYENQSERREPGMILKTEISALCFWKQLKIYRFHNFFYTYSDGIYLPLSCSVFELFRFKLGFLVSCQSELLGVPNRPQ